MPLRQVRTILFFTIRKIYFDALERTYPDYEFVRQRPGYVYAAYMQCRAGARSGW